MFTEEALDKLGESIDLIRTQMEELEPGSEKQLRSAEIYCKLAAVQQNEQKLQTECDKVWDEKELSEKRFEEDVKEKKRRRRLDVAGIAVPAATSLVGLATSLIFESGHGITFKSGMNWIGKVFNWKK